MITIRPVERALVPINSEAAQLISGSNYDEFQHDEEIWEILQTNPLNILHITMSHCDVPERENIGEEGSEVALQKALSNMKKLVKSDLTRIVENVLWVYEIKTPSRPDHRQIGLGGFARTEQLRTETTPDGVIIRNEAIRLHKAQGRADLTRTIQAFIGTVNNAIDDPKSELCDALETYADSRPSDYCALDEDQNRHCVWLVSEPNQIDNFIKIASHEPYAYVADGNHRSMAAAMLGYKYFLAVFFPSSRMGLAPYNRLVKKSNNPIADLCSQLEDSFEVEALGNLESYAPARVHEIGLYTQNCWYKLIPRDSAFDPSNAANSIDAGIVQRKIFAEIFGIEDERDTAITFVGGNKDSAYLKSKVDSGEYEYAFSLAPVTMEQFMDVCKQNQYMPPKSTWFMPKIRSGLVMALWE